MFIDKVLDLRVQLMKKGGKNKSVVYNFVQCTNCRCKIFCHVGLHLIHLHFYSLEMFSYLVTQ